MSFARRFRVLRRAQSDFEEHLILRVSCQFQFAKGLKLLLRAGDAWTESHDQALSEAQRIVASDLALESLVHEFERILMPLSQSAKRYRIHCVGHGHIDMNWMWSYPETVATCHDTFESVLRIMDEDPDVTYSQSQTAVYEITERFAPEQFERIKDRIREGRWEVTATQWVEGDKNLALGDSLARSYLYSRRYCLDKLGLTPEQVPVQWEPDTFGHANTIPMLAQFGGVKYYYACRLGGGFESPRVGQERPPLFWWESPNGDRILVNRETTWYNSYVNIGDDISEPAIRFWSQYSQLRDWLNVFGIGNHGGGPTRREIAYYRALQTWPIYPTLIFSTAKDYFESVAEQAADFPTLNHELNFEFLGCYTSQSLIKQANRLGENYCLEAEALCALSGLDRPELRESAWRNVLFNQFHDILPGSGVRETREHARGLFQATAAATASLKRAAMKKIECEIDTQSILGEFGAASQSGTPYEGGSGQGARLSGLTRASGGGRTIFPFIVFNSCAWKRLEAVTISIFDASIDPKELVCVDDRGDVQTPFLVEESREWDHQKATFLVYVEVPALGYRTIWLKPDEGESRSDQTLQILDSLSAKTDKLYVSFDRFGGGLKEFRGPAESSMQMPFRIGSLLEVTEKPYMMTSWVLGEEGAAKLLPVERFDLYGESRNQGTLSASGTPPFLLGTFRHSSDKGTIRAVQRMLVHSRKPRVDVECELDYREIGDPKKGIPGLKVGFPRFGEVAIFETPFGVVERTAARDVPTLRFVHSPSESGGVTILTTEKGAFYQDSEQSYLRVIRSSYDPDPLPEINQQTFRYAIVLHETPPTNAELVRLGMEFNHPLMVQPATFHVGNRPLCDQIFETEADNVVITSVKPAEDSSNAWVVHLANYGFEETCRIVLTNRKIDRVEVVDAMERAGSPVEHKRTELTCLVRALGNVALRIEFAD